MKIIVVSLLMMGCLMGLSLSIDIFQGSDVFQSFYNVVNPFHVVEVVELFVLYFLLLLCFAEPAYLFIKKRRKKEGE
ncbi:hypothetical protein [Priestia endophytica]|uniref:hypothetical protein n=1 Tax=Priestia endophytica TaxID=135735 RepID=UPI00204037BB|nr:hypothetical protein [Priestia endophytica]MCM3538708.1 hypothetical protein [Priestia endophytica]